MPVVCQLKINNTDALESMAGEGLRSAASARRFQLDFERMAPSVRSALALTRTRHATPARYAACWSSSTARQATTILSTFHPVEDIARAVHNSVGTPARRTARYEKADKATPVTIASAPITSSMGALQESNEVLSDKVLSNEILSNEILQKGLKDSRAVVLLFPSAATRRLWRIRTGRWPPKGDSPRLELCLSRNCVRRNVTTREAIRCLLL